MGRLFKRLKTFTVVSAVAVAGAYAQQTPLDMDRFIDDLMKRMTLEEKLVS